MYVKKFNSSIQVSTQVIDCIPHYVPGYDNSYIFIV